MRCTIGTTFAYALPMVLGAVLRVHGLSRQILVDDEWHLVHSLRGGASLGSVVAEFGRNDHSIGLGAVLWLVTQVTFADETVLRLPSLLAGLVLLVFFPLALRGLLGECAAIVLTWLVAVSPFLCFASRQARPYAITVLLVSCASVSFYAWLVRGSHAERARWAYVLTAGLAPVFHLPSLPAVLAAPLAVPVARAFGATAVLAGGREIVRTGLAAVGLMAALLVIPLASSAEQVVARLSVDRLTQATLGGAAELLTGTTNWAVIATLAGAAMIGVATLWRRRRLFAGCVLATLLCQAAAVALSGAAALHVPVVAARYLSVVLPLVLVLPAVGIAATARFAGAARSRGVATLLGASVGAVLFWSGPLGWIYEGPNDFTNHVSYQADYEPGRYFERFRPVVMSPFYTDVLARLPKGSTTIVEAPWYFYFHSYAYYQRVHRQHVMIGFVGDESAPPRIGEISAHDPALRLRRAVSVADVPTLRARGVGYVVLHHDPLTETRWPAGVTDVAVDVRDWVATCRRWYGEPIYRDAIVTVFALTGSPPPHGEP